MEKIQKVISGLLLGAIFSVSCSRVNTDITVDELKEHIRFLASEELQGRDTGTPGDSLAADYIREKLSDYGLVPITGDGMQRFEVVAKVTAGSGNRLSADGTSFNTEEDYMPASFTENASLTSEVVFAGYGFNISNDSVKWDDYAGLDVKGKWVMILRADPDPDNPASKYLSYSGDRDKTMAAKDNGAAGVLLVSGQLLDKQDIIDPPARGEFSAGIPVLKIKRTVADAILSKSGLTITQLETRLNKNLKPASLTTGVTVDAAAEIVKHMVKTRNVAMILPGKDPLLRDEYIIFGAHYDHLGTGGSSSRVPDTTAVHYGADDNASGTAMLIEIAGKFAGTKNSHGRSLVFVAFSGEEKGLLGSKYFTENPGLDLSKAGAMINFDMVGRMKETRDLSIGGVGTAAGLREMVEGFSDTARYSLALTDEGSGPSDHSAFYAKNIPVLFISTGAHTDYHTPFDTWDKINYEGMTDVADLSFRLASKLASDSERLAFTEAGPKEGSARMGRRRGVTLGIMPDFTGAVKNGLRADLVTPGKPAAIGGMKKGDIIVAINGKQVNNVYDYMYRLDQLKRGETISVEVLRDNRKEVLIIQL